MNINMDIPGLKGVLIEKCEQLQERIILHVSIPKREHLCPSCGLKTSKVHDYRIQKIKHLKWFERLTVDSITVAIFTGQSMKYVEKYKSIGILMTGKKQRECAMFYIKMKRT